MTSHSRATDRRHVPAKSGATSADPDGNGQANPISITPLDEVDKKLERHGHCFARYADDCNVYVSSRKAGERVMALLRLESILQQ